MIPLAGIVGLGVHLLVYLVDAVSFTLYSRSAWRLYGRRHSDALVPGRLALISAILLSLVYSFVNELNTEDEPLSIMEPLQISIGILLIVGWTQLVDTWFAQPKRAWRFRLER